MGGKTFIEQTRSLTLKEHDVIIETIFGDKQPCVPFRLKNKTNFNDIDIVEFEEDKLIELIRQAGVEIKTIKKIESCKGTKYENYSLNLLSTDNIQFDIIRPFNNSPSAKEFTRAFFSFGFANIFLRQLTTVVSSVSKAHEMKAQEDFKISYLGLFCYNNSLKLPSDCTYTIDETTRLITDLQFLFSLIDLNLSRYVKGFKDEFELLDYFKTSKFYPQVSFKVDNRFKHDIKRIAGFANLYHSNLLPLS